MHQNKQDPFRQSHMGAYSYASFPDMLILCNSSLFFLHVLGLGNGKL